ncbi:MAG: hypothetical protein QOF33_2301, partial [Thermomicrobiales bacterium]|nr:hypothetical protein [Thermomicrobiales bacterium]
VVAPAGGNGGPHPSPDTDDTDDAAEVASVRVLPSTGTGSGQSNSAAWLLIAGEDNHPAGVGSRLRRVPR